MTHEDWMALALVQADAGLGGTAPNPSVGAVLVRDGELIGEGHTQPAGGPHAERVALYDCVSRGNDPRGATMYVTLEPCCHVGKTPPCSEALIEAGIARVFVGVLDPFPPMRGKSAAQLRDHGIEVEVGIKEEACARQVRGFARAVTHRLPEVTCKAGMSADGRIATANGESKWITSPEARADAHHLRAEHDAILVGIGTALADDPQLTVRAPATPRHGGPVPVVLDSNLRLPPSARLLQGGRAIVVAATDAAERDLPAQIVRINRGPDGRLAPARVLEALVERGLHRVMVEGGASIHRSLIEHGLVDNLVLYMAGVLLPGGIPWIGGGDVASLADATRMQLRSVATVGPDVRLLYELEHAVAPHPLAALRSATAR